MIEFFSLISEEKPGGLFDFDSTLPFVAIQFVLLMIVLKFILYSPVLNILKKRKTFMSKITYRITQNLQFAQISIINCLQLLNETKTLVKNSVTKRVQFLDNSLIFIAQDFQKRYKRNENNVNFSFILARLEALEYFLQYSTKLTLQSIDFFTIRSDIWTPSIIQAEKNYFRQIYFKDLKEHNHGFRFDFISGY